MNPDEFLRQANRLVSQEEVDCRSAISRAYYSLFHEAKIRLESHHNKEWHQLIESDKKLIKDTRNFIPNYHSVVVRLLAKLNKSYGFDYNGFKEKRTQADYFIRDAFLSERDSKIIIGEIDKFIAKIKNI
ncbi:MAG: hypothetical protein KGH57_00885 [Candidatus Micrarchaeota archaeon]|nr:hypothetical protein [Candidatus Micrarchaeota archaeon]